jgi:hypothetical protein
LGELPFMEPDTDIVLVGKIKEEAKVTEQKK